MYHRAVFVLELIWLFVSDFAQKVKCLMGFHSFQWEFTGIKQAAKYTCKYCKYIEPPITYRTRK